MNKWRLRLAAAAFGVTAWVAATIGISVGVDEWRDTGTVIQQEQIEELRDLIGDIRVEPLPTTVPGVVPAKCQAAVGLFAAYDEVLERTSNPSDNLLEQWGRAARNMDELCLVPTPTPPSN